MDASAYITAGGKSLRFNSDKSLYVYRGKPLIQHVYDAVRSVCPSVFVVADDPGKYSFLNTEVIPDIVKNFGPTGGLYAALAHAATERIFFCGCDMPHMSAALVRHMIALSRDYDVVVPVVPKGYDPLHAVYSKRCLSFVRESIAAGARKIIAFYPRVRVRDVPVEEMQRFGDWNKMLFNVNVQHDVAPSQ